MSRCPLTMTHFIKLSKPGFIKVLLKAWNYMKQKTFTVAFLIAPNDHSCKVFVQSSGLNVEESGSLTISWAESRHSEGIKGGFCFTLAIIISLWEVSFDNVKTFWPNKDTTHIQMTNHEDNTYIQDVQKFLYFLAFCSANFTIPHALPYFWLQCKDV